MHRGLGSWRLLDRPASRSDRQRAARVVRSLAALLEDVASRNADRRRLSIGRISWACAMSVLELGKVRIPIRFDLPDESGGQWDIAERTCL